MGWPGRRADLGDIAGVGFFVYCHDKGTSFGVAACFRPVSKQKSCRLLENLYEVKTMLAARMEEWKENYRKEGL